MTNKDRPRIMSLLPVWGCVAWIAILLLTLASLGYAVDGFQRIYKERRWSECEQICETRDSRAERVTDWGCLCADGSLIND